VNTPLNVTTENALGMFVLNRPKALNAIDPPMLEALEDALNNAEKNEQLRVIVISGTGERAFCAGADIKCIRNMHGAQKRRFIEDAYRLFERIANFPLPSIAAIQGFALGGGLELAMSCDLRIADESSSLGLPEMALGSVPSFGAAQRLPLLVGHGVAMELLMTGRQLCAEEARQCGLVNQAVPKGHALAAARQMGSVLSLRSREALRYGKVAIRQSASPALAAAFHALVSDACHQGPEYQANTDKFLNASSSAAAIHARANLK